jgi:hypothetical protein
MLPSSLLWRAGFATLLLSGLAQAEPYGFKGATLGSNVGLIASNSKYGCRSVKTPSGDRICSLLKDETETMAGVPVDSLFYFYDQSALTDIVIGLDEKNFELVVKALGAKYGIPARSTEIVKNLKDRSFENHIYTWHQPGESIVAQRYSGRLDRSSIRIRDETAAQRIRLRRELIEKQPQQDL